MPIMTQAISKKEKEEGKIGQVRVELELRKSGVIVDGAISVLFERMFGWGYALPARVW